MLLAYEVYCVTLYVHFSSHRLAWSQCTPSSCKRLKWQEAGDLSRCRKCRGNAIVECTDLPCGPAWLNVLSRQQSKSRFISTLCLTCMSISSRQFLTYYSFAQYAIAAEAVPNTIQYMLQWPNLLFGLT